MLKSFRTRLAAVVASPQVVETVEPVPVPVDEESANLYEALYEAHIPRLPDEEIAGGGDFERIGRIELSLLKEAGLQPGNTLVDFGCGTGRLAVQAIPELAGGHYVGIDISETTLARARARVAREHSEPPCTISWLHSVERTFPLADGSVDVVCAFSVFTHMEHEDAYWYLKDARRVVRPNGRFVFSCLPLDLEAAQTIFLDAARYDVRTRWSAVRNVTTTREMMTTIAALAGWSVVRWYAGDERNIRLGDSGDLAALGQSSCVLEPATPER